MAQSLTIRAPKQGLLDITNEIARWVAHASVTMGLLTLFLHHTLASILIRENADPDVLADMEDFFANLAPEDNSPLPPYRGRTRRHARRRAAKNFAQVVATPEPLAIKLRAAVKAPLKNWGHLQLCSTALPQRACAD